MIEVNLIDQDVGERLRALRFQHRISIGELASRARLSPEQIVCFENGELRIDARIMLRLCKILDIRPIEFFAPLYAKQATKNQVKRRHTDKAAERSSRNHAAL
ncbi:transcriptional regulator with XRE-family HTH domain [Rhodoblastus sphagnicola]|uniref:helix-turn-helix domain-containing protein n=1 Tax=Rhodoblastus sphagnicola TaxID=333368 RepID=UPI001304AA7B|nr:helix-turn-helix transcriptional regulator [Rhodoblastus sphagnicola]MBB4200855.1 transcriptional regulator with XRE-family HTH domain [Rhodoblastus sphagnicola]